MARWLTLVKKYQFKLQPFHAKPSMCWWTGRRDMGEILLKTALTQLINQSTDHFHNVFLFSSLFYMQITISLKNI